MPDLEASLGRKADASGIDPTRIGAGAKPEQGEVEGQQLYQGGLACPWCWTLNDVVTDIARWQGFTCWSCGGYFEV